MDPESRALTTSLKHNSLTEDGTTPCRLFSHTFAKARMHVSVHPGSWRAPLIQCEGPAGWCERFTRRSRTDLLKASDQARPPWHGPPGQGCDPNVIIQTSKSFSPR